jgi:hypothetical protein
MLRIICRRSDDCCTVNTGAPPLIEHRTFDVDLPEIEAWLRSNPEFKYEQKQVIGVEIIDSEGK